MSLTTPVRQGAAKGLVPPDASWPAANQTLEQQILELVNQHRAGLGLSQLGLASSLRSSAEWKARHMAAYHYLDHDDPAPPVARGWYQRLTDNGYTAALCAENIAQGYQTASAVLAGWLASPGHKENLEDAYWTVTGLGAATASNGQVYWVQDFGVGAPDTPPTPPTPPVGTSNRDLADTCLAQLKLTTIGYDKWKTKIYKPATKRADTAWQKALDALAKIT